jgi:hypothetical protein
LCVQNVLSDLCLFFFLLEQGPEGDAVQQEDYDCKKRHGAEAEEIIEAERKFAESYQVTTSRHFEIWVTKMF